MVEVNSTKQLRIIYMTFAFTLHCGKMINLAMEYIMISETSDKSKAEKTLYDESFDENFLQSTVNTLKFKQTGKRIMFLSALSSLYNIKCKLEDRLWLWSIGLLVFPSSLLGWSFRLGNHTQTTTIAILLSGSLATYIWIAMKYNQAILRVSQCIDVASSLKGNVTL